MFSNTAGNFNEKIPEDGRRHEQKIKAFLILENGPVFEGYSFGHEEPVAGEVVFNTSMVGYPESLTDPSSAGQILTVTFPLVGNYGVPPDTKKDGVYDFYESEKIQVAGLIVSSYSASYSHWNATKSLEGWLKEHKIPALYGVDTRELTKFIRERGVTIGKIVFDSPDADQMPFDDPSLRNLIAERNLVTEVSCRGVVRYNCEGGAVPHVVLVDCGVKHNIIRCFMKRGVRVTRVPWDYDFNSLEWDGLFISNGPGDPALCGVTIENLRVALTKDKPIFGICMGNLLLALAAGAKTYKLKCGHRGHNQPVRQVGTNRCFITSQNHGYAVDADTLPKDWEVLFTNMNDKTNEGIRHTFKPFFATQFHLKEGSADTEFLFDRFIAAMQGGDSR